MLCVGVGIKTFGSWYTTYDMQSICIITAREDGTMLRSLSLDIRPRGDGPPYYRVHPAWKGDLADHHFAALPAHQVDTQITAFILQELYTNGYVKREVVESLNTQRSAEIMHLIANSVFTVTKHSHIVLPFISVTLPISALLLSANVVDLAAYDYGTYGFRPREYTEIGAYPFVGTCEHGYPNLFHQVSAYIAQWASIVATRADSVVDFGKKSDPDQVA